MYSCATSCYICVKELSVSLVSLPFSLTVRGPSDISIWQILCISNYNVPRNNICTQVVSLEGKLVLEIDIALILMENSPETCSLECSAHAESHYVLF